ncbi:MAG: UDP-N-acetylmuramate dehydrogenase [Clostridia bacterium]|nr:UDP-N-acetylmuramate dehydrogenase [Clostridia bacterium]
MPHPKLDCFLESLPSDEYLLKRDVPMSALTSFRTGGPAAYCLSPKTPDAFCRAIAFLTEEKIPYLLLGHGTNVLAPDEGYDSVLLLTGELKETAANGEQITLGAGVLMNSAATFAKDHALSGLEFAYGIPGSVGGALAMNAGAYEHEIGELPITVLACDRNGSLRTLTTEECRFGYRESIFQGEGLVALSCTLTLTPDDKDAIRARMDDYLARRKKSQPLEYPSAGSFFRRPTGYYAGKLIQDAGMKGARVGGAQISEKHAGFLINYDRATSADIRALGKKVQDEVQKQFGVTLQREVKYLGEEYD